MIKVFSDSNMGSCFREKDNNLIMMVDDDTRIHFMGYTDVNEPNYTWNISDRINKKKIDQLRLRANYLDTGIAMCSTDVLEHFSSEECSDLDNEIDFITHILNDECSEDFPCYYTMEKDDYIVR